MSRRCFCTIDHDAIHKQCRYRSTYDLHDVTKTTQKYASSSSLPDDNNLMNDCQTLPPRLVKFTVYIYAFAGSNICDKWFSQNRMPSRH